MKTFAITAFGRSGTTFLARVMNLSALWTVEHEPRDAFDEEAIEDLSNCQELPIPIAQAFNREYYGEVNSRLRFWFHKLPVEKRGVIIRDPKEIVISIANRGYTAEKTQSTIRQFGFFYGEFHRWLEDDSVVRIDFHQMTSDILYLENVLFEFSIADVDLSRIHLHQKVNETKNRQYGNIDELPGLLQDIYYSINWDSLRSRGGGRRSESTDAGSELGPGDPGASGTLARGGR